MPTALPNAAQEVTGLSSCWQPCKGSLATCACANNAQIDIQEHTDRAGPACQLLALMLEEWNDWCAGKDRIEQLLALGATRWEAVQASLQRCVRVALTPILNQMNVVGIVSIPGEHVTIS